MTVPQKPVSESITNVRSPRAGGWTTGLARFAGVVMIILGVLDIVVGTGALFGGQVVGVGVHHAFSISATTWGWVQIVVGALVALAGMSVVIGQLWGRVVGIVLVCVSLGVAFLSLSHHPTGLVLAVALGVAVIWALCVFDEAASAASPTMLD